ncbi:DNA-binding response regulator [Aquimarina sp. MAR_2010_214]|uniref:response regulator transcription factor n=1 Tax=Aquimarina sp. MAR_2010_214 TaxID=1250026 RepID=UPI0013040273|nr:DNA-binding response regulator [Aquimarina sp. MAR_2010_214]
MSKKEIKILILEDEFLIAQDIFETVTNNGYINTKIANSYSEAKQVTQYWFPNIVLSDINLETCKTGIDFVTNMKNTHQNFEVIFISAINDKNRIKEAISFIPLGYLTKPFDEKQLNISIELAINTINAKINTISPELKHLSRTELKIIQLISKGYQSIEISQKLSVSEKTIRNHRYNIIKKLKLPAEKNNLLKWAMIHIR